MTLMKHPNVIPAMINRLENGTTSNGLLRVGQENCHNKNEIINELFKMKLDLLLVQEPESWFKNKCHSSWVRVMDDGLWMMMSNPARPLM
jgi:hypothetical protein